MSESNCPFCPGREHETPPEVWRLEDANGDWRLRAFPNKFPILNPNAELVSQSNSWFRTIPGEGWHEVIVESPDHAADLATATVDGVQAVLTAYRERYRALRDAGAKHIVVFRNHGSTAGTSLDHPHSQVVGMRICPPDLERLLEVSTRFSEGTNKNLYLEVLTREIEDGRRVIMENLRFVAFQPFASSHPYETWIMPKVTQPSFGEVPDGTLEHLAIMLRDVLNALASVLDDPDYNYVIRSAPEDEPRAQAFGWNLQIVPRLTKLAGFELGTGIRVNPTWPEESASVLKNAIENR